MKPLIKFYLTSKISYEMIKIIKEINMTCKKAPQKVKSSLVVIAYEKMSQTAIVQAPVANPTI